MTRSAFYPPADRSQWYGGGRFGGTIMDDVDTVVLHTTEGGGWPAYSGGAVAPTLTALPDFNAKRLLWRQHFQLNESGRALMNKLGGVQTNTRRCAQVELVGTCDPATAARIPGIMFWPLAPDWALQGVADFLTFMRDDWGVPLTTSVPWIPYPASYGASGARMSFAQWNSYEGVCAHAHVPENDHGDTGAFPILRTLALAGGHPLPDPSPTPAPAPKPVQEDDAMKIITTVSNDGTSSLYPSLLTDAGSVGLNGDELRIMQRYDQELRGATGAAGKLTQLEQTIANGLFARIRGGATPQQVAGAVLAAVQAGTTLDELAAALKELPAETVAALRDALGTPAA